MSSRFISTQRTWVAMCNRCNSPNDPRYADYGGRGIKVCTRWAVYANFLADMGLRPAEHLQLDRTDNNGDYCPENCRWVTSAENNANKRAYQKANNNKSGVTGVAFHENKQRWTAYLGRTLLYNGQDFLAACCARKSAELT